MADLLLGIDVGTYASKAVLTDLGGRVLRAESVPHEVSFPQPGWAEQDPETVWWADVVTLCNKVLDGSQHSGNDVGAVAVSAIGPCMVPVDAAGMALRNGVLYGVDTRAVAEIDFLEEQIGPEEIRRIGRLDLSSQAVAPKILWFQRNEPELWGRTAKVLTASSYLIHHLTGEFVIDHHQAAQFVPLYDATARSWTETHSDLVCDIDRLPRLGWPNEVAGTVTQTAADATGLVAGTPVSFGTVDALAESQSVGVVAPGDLMVMYGSTAFFILVTEGPAPMGRGWALPGCTPGSDVLAAGMATTGSVTRWFADHLTGGSATESAYEELFAEAAESPPGARGLLALPYFSGERTPIDDPKARGIMAGLSLAHTRGDMFRAVLEGIAFGIRHNIEAMDSASPVRRLVPVGGGATGGLLLQIVSDVTQRPQHRSAITIGAAYGDAFLAGVAAGLVEPAALERWVVADSIVEPSPELRSVYDARFADYLSLYQSTKDVVHRLASD